MELQEQLSSCLFCAILLATIPFSESFEVISSPAVTGIIGQDVVLPCQISTGTQPDNMEVQWKKIIQTHIESVYEYRAQTGQDVPGQKYQGRTVLLKDGFTSGNVSLKLKNVQPADCGIYICIVKSNEWSDAAATKLKISEFKNDEKLRDKEKKKVQFSLPETPEKSKETAEENTEFEKGETLEEKEKKRERRRRSFPPEIFENNTVTCEDNTEKMVTANLALHIIEINIIGIVFIIYLSRKRRRDPEREPLISAEEGSYGPGVDESQSQGRLQRENNQLQAELSKCVSNL
ncbi:butyrophilin subfamily 1 member A1-like [Mauremys reevesii]|uniref:butyrophilin subfamily 1 member A1-like n=1 Tax=Mauremys reevesii TaxID=260615 RepID=UPI00193F87FF|nr:butyrophilin subfamily 1 member A1-like [Mauremys reevesii]